MQRRDGARKLKLEREEYLRDQQDLEFKVMHCRQEKDLAKKKLESYDEEIDRLAEEMEDIQKDIDRFQNDKISDEKIIDHL